MKNWLHNDQLLNNLDQCGLLCKESVIKGDLQIIDYTSRNKNFLILQKESLFVKIGIDEERVQSLDIETAVYRLGKENKELADLVPKLKYADSGVLITEAVEDSNLLDDVLNNSKEFQIKKIGLKLGRGLSTTSQLPCFIDSEINSYGIPWAFMLSTPPKEVYLGLSAAGLEIIQIIQKDEVYIHELQKLQQSWNNDNFIHNDIKSTNILITEKEKPSIKLIDWEICGRGDSHWDLGNVWTSVLHAWLSSIENPSSPTQSRIQLSDLFEFNQGVLTGYKTSHSERGLTFSLLKSIQYSGVSLLKTVIEIVESQNKIGKIHILYIQLSDFLIKNPLQASVQLLGLHENK
jgi:serine/threonine protein kinase